MEQKLFDACSDKNKISEVKEIMRNNPTLNINWKNGSGFTALYRASQYGHVDFVQILLAHPDIDVNQKYNGETPFYRASANEETPIVRMMLGDARVMINESDGGYTALSRAASFGYLEVIKWMIASGRELDLGKENRKLSDAIGQAKQEKKTEVVSLLERFKKDQGKTRQEIRKELGIIDFPVVMPPKFTRERFLAFIDTIGPKETEQQAKERIEKEKKAKEEKEREEKERAERAQKEKEAKERKEREEKERPKKEIQAFLAQLQSRKTDFNVSEMIKCYICKNTFVNPKTLPCLHTYCLECLDKQQHQGPFFHRCENCRAPFTVPASRTMKELTCCVLVDSLLKAAAVPVTNLVIMCECEEAEATMHCVEDQLNFCDKCVVIHKKGKATAHHQVVSLDDAMNGDLANKRVPRCQKHPQFEINTYCKTCNSATCPQCAVESHRNHSFCPLSEVAEPCRDEIAGFVIRVTEREKEAEGTVESFELSIEEFERNRAEPEKEVKQICASLRSAVDAREAQLLGEINKRREKVIQEKHEVERTRIELSGFRKANEGLLIEGTPLEIAGDHQQIKARNEEIKKIDFMRKPSQPTTITFTGVNAEEAKRIISTIGSIGN